MRILVAEDEVVTVELCAAVLEERGHKVYVTYDGQQALNVYKNSSQPFAFCLSFLNSIIAH